MIWRSLVNFLEHWFISMLLTGRKWIYHFNVSAFGVVFKRKVFALWILFTLISLPGLFKFNILFLNILLVLIGIIPYSGFTGLNNIYIYIGNVMHNSAELLDVKLAWYSSSSTHSIYLYHMKYGLIIHALRPTLTSLIFEILETRATFLEPSVKCTLINCAFKSLSYLPPPPLWQDMTQGHF